MAAGTFSFKAVISYLLAAGAFVTALPPDVCPNGISTVTVAPGCVEEYPVAVNEWFDIDTQIVINGGQVTIDITNAPTFVNTVVTATVTSTVTLTSGESVATPTTDTFAIQVLPFGAAPARKRQETSCVDNSEVGFLGPSGFVVSSISEAATWFLSNGSLINAQTGRPLSVDAALATMPFSVGPVTGFITQTFTLEGTSLRWRNPAFPSGEAAFYYSESNRALFISFDGTAVNDAIQAFPYSVDPFNIASASLCSSATISSISSTSVASSSESSSIAPESVSSTESSSAASSSESSSAAASSSESSSAAASSSESSSEAASSSASSTVASSASSTVASSSASASATNDPCAAPDPSCATAELSSDASSAISTLADLGTSATDLGTLLTTATGGGLDAAAAILQVPGALTDLTTGLTTAGTSLGGISPLAAGCDADAVAIAAASFAQGFTTLANQISTGSTAIAAIPGVGTLFGTFVTGLGTGTAGINTALQALAPSRACYINAQFEALTTAIEGIAS